MAQNRDYLVLENEIIIGRKENLWRKVKSGYKTRKIEKEDKEKSKGFILFKPWNSGRQSPVEEY